MIRQPLTLIANTAQPNPPGGWGTRPAGGKALLRKRGGLTEADLTEAWWRREWESARLYLTADGEKGKAWGNETIRWNPGVGWLETKLPVPLAHLANRPHGRYRLPGPGRVLQPGR